MEEPKSIDQAFEIIKNKTNTEETKPAPETKEQVKAPEVSKVASNNVEKQSKVSDESSQKNDSTSKTTEEDPEYEFKADGKLIKKKLSEIFVLASNGYHGGERNAALNKLEIDIKNREEAVKKLEEKYKNLKTNTVETEDIKEEIKEEPKDESNSSLDDLLFGEENKKAAAEKEVAEKEQAAKVLEEQKKDLSQKNLELNKQKEILKSDETKKLYNDTIASIKEEFKDIVDDSMITETLLKLYSTPGTEKYKNIKTQLLELHPEIIDLLAQKKAQETLDSNSDDAKDNLVTSKVSKNTSKFDGNPKSIEEAFEMIKRK